MAIAAPLHCDWLGSRLAHRRMWIRSQRNSGVGAFHGVVTAGLEEISQNHVLASAALAGLSAQLLKPLTAAVAGKGFNWKLMLRSGGTPSSHAASMVAAATVLGLERGFSDSLFGFALVVAGIVMYDAQGVRREVGKHAEILNTIAFAQVSKEPSSPRSSKSESLVEAQVGAMKSSNSLEREVDSSSKNGPFSRSTKFFKTAQNLPSMKEGEVSMQEIGSESGWQYIPLKESIGHTRGQVLAGALFGATLSIISHAIGLS